MRQWFSLVVFLVCSAGALNPSLASAELADTVRRIKPSIVGVGVYAPTSRPPARLAGTGFVVADGRHVITNDHVLPKVLDVSSKEQLAVLIPGGRSNVRIAARVATDPVHDLALLKISDAPLPAMRLGDADQVREGELYAFTGFPIGTVLGLYPVTHHGIVSAVTPIAVPLLRGRDLNPALIRRLRSPYTVFQLDATAYPGNSGSPVYDPETGEVIGIINKVFVKGSKEAMLENPSGITYAIPVKYAKELIEKAGLAP
ncbi:MAG TPA: serine protease [Gammaproteobacteria bacterium]|nr:serine protease [Gammaproteobacteria bacterium]